MAHHLDGLSQDNLFARFTTRESKNRIYQNLVNNTINRNLSIPLTDSTEANWEDAFGAMQLLLLRNETIDKKIAEAFGIIETRSISFQRALLELAYTNYPSEYQDQAAALLLTTGDVKIFAMCAEYLLLHADSLLMDTIEETAIRKFSDREPGPLLTMLSEHIAEIRSPSLSFVENKFFTDILSKKFLPGQIVLYSFQRKDRNYPGIAVIRNREGKFIRDTAHLIFHIPQLARSISNLQVILPMEIRHREFSGCMDLMFQQASLLAPALTYSFLCQGKLP